MDNAIYVGLSRQIILERELDIAANNLANVDTAGFKFEEMINNSDPTSTPAPGGGAPTPVTFVADGGVARNFTQGSLIQTGAMLDVAIDGRGFFQINTANGPRYTRDGRFKTDPSGKIVNQDGDSVAGSGGDIVLDPKKGIATISPNGVISQNGETVGKLSVVDFDSLSALSKVGANQYENASNLTPQTSTTAQMRQGMLETSNVEPVRQITRLIEINRAYDAISTMMDTTAQLSSSAVQRLGAVNPT
jgi:flagellar basal-body rod protein FlgF